MRNRILLAVFVSVVFLAMGRFAATAAENAPSAIKAFCIDFNWGPKGINGFAGPGVWADASPEDHVRWYEGLGANVIQTFAVSCNGYAWYKGGIIPPQPGLKFDFLTDVVRLGHAKGIRVMGYYCVGANTLWGQKHPDLSYGTPGVPHIPLTTAYLDYLCGSMEDALKRTGMDGFMIDWVWNPSQRTLRPEKNAREHWLECEKAMYRELMGQPFPGEDRLSPSDKLAYERRALDRCWTRIHAAAKRANPKCVIWLSCNDLKHPTVIGSKMFREIDWLMNEHPDPASIAAVAKMAGPRTQLVQCLVGWGDQHDAKKVLENPDFRKLGIYGFAKPGENSLPLPIEQYRSQAPTAFQGNDKNIAVLLRYFHGLPLDHVAQPQHPGLQSLKPEVIGSQVASGNEPPFPIHRVPAPLFDDPLWHGAADPTVTWNPVKQEWWVYYTQRRAALKNPKGVDWCHGSAIGIATSKDGMQWKYIGICTGDEGLGEPIKSNCSWWAPCVIHHGGRFHLFVACVDGIYTEWTGKRSVKHFTSQDGKSWKYQMTLPLSSDNCIDPCIYRIGEKWLVWYKDERHGSKTYAAESPDLKTWMVIGPVITDVPHEAPLVWRWKGAYWMIVDAWANGLRIYRSEDGVSNWKYNRTILLAPGKRAKDSVQGGHPYVLEQGERAIVFYHVHYARGRETVLQAAELEMDSKGKVICDRDKHATKVVLPMALEASQVNVLMADRANRTSMLNVTIWGKPEGRAWVDKWQQPEDSFQWLVEVPEAGRYEVSVLAEGSAQAEAEITSGGGRLTFRLAKGWDKLILPESLPVPKGQSIITLRLLKPDNAKLKSLELINLAARDDIHRRIEQLRAPTKWLRDAKYGIMFQWGGWGYPQHGPKKPWPKMIDDFDVEAFARMAEDTGAGYVIWSVTWCSYHFPAPIKAIDRIAPGHTSQRDLVGDLADALAKRNIKLMLYYHEGHPDKDWWPKNWDYADTDRKEKFVNNLCDVMSEVGQRYGPKVAGWFLDDGMLFYPAPFERITKALKAGNPDRLVSYNSWILPRLTEFQEVYMGEGFAGSAETPVGGDGIFPTGPQKGLFAQGMSVLDGPDWGINSPDTKINQPAFSAEQAVGLVRRAAERGMTLSFNLLIYEDGSVSPASLEVLRAVRKAVRGK